MVEQTPCRPETTRGSATAHGLRRASAVGIIATTCGLLAVFITSALAPQLHKAADVTAVRLGLAVAVFFGAGTVASPVCGRLADRIGSIRVMRMALGIAAASLAGMGLAVRGWVGLVVALGVAGLANGAIQPSANRYISRLTPAGRQGLAFGIKQAAIPAAVLLGGLSVPAGLYLTGWRGVYLGAAVLAIAVAAVIRMPPTVRGGQRAAARPAVSRPLSRRPLVVLALGWGLASMGANALGAFFVLGAVHIGFSPVTAALLAVAGSVTSITVRVGVGFLADRWTGNGLGVVAAMSGIGAVGVALLATDTVPAFVLATVVGYGIGWGWAGLANYAVVRTHPGQPGKATGLTQAGASAGACAGPLTFGALVAGTSYELAWVAAAVTLLAAVGFILAGRRMLTGPVPQE